MTLMSTKDAEGCLQLVAMTMADNAGLGVTFGEFDTASYNGERIFLPYLPTAVDQEAFQFGLGLLTHEVGHARYSAMDAIAQSNASSPLAGAFHQVLEDPWMEAVYQRDYPYAGCCMAELTRQWIEKGRQPDAVPTLPVSDQVGAWLYNLLYGHVVGHAGCTALADANEAVVEASVGAAAVVQLKSMALAITHARSSWDISQIAIGMAEFVQRFVQAQEELPPPDAQPQGQGDQQSGSGSQPQGQGGQQSGSGSQPQGQGDQQPGSGSQPQGQGGQQSGSGSQPQGQGDQQPGSGSQPQGQGDQQSGSGSQPQGQGDQQSGSAGEQSAGTTAPNAQQLANLRQLLQSDQLGDDVRRQMWSTMSEAGSPLRFNVPAPAVQASPDDSLLASADDIAGALSLRFRRLFESHARMLESPSLRGKRFARDLARRVAVGHPHLFVQEEDHRAVNTHVSLAIDVSSSMKNTIGVARAALVACLVALDKTRGISCSACAFPDPSERSVVVLKSAKERVQAVASRLRSHQLVGSTPMANALVWCLHQARVASEPRKVVIVITDGEPNASHVAHVRALTEQAAKSGVELCAIGIGSDAHVDVHFRNHVVISTVSELPQALFGLLGSMVRVKKCVA